MSVEHGSCESLNSALNQECKRHGKTEKVSVITDHQLQLELHSTIKETAKLQGICVNILVIRAHVQRF